MRQYAVYKGDDIMAIGTAEECAEALHVQSKYIRWLTTPTAKKRLAKRKKTNFCTVAEILDDSE